MASFTAFSASRRVATGSMLDIALQLRRRQGEGVSELALIFDDETGRQIDIDIRGSHDELRSRFGPSTVASAETSAEGAPVTVPAKRGRGRPRLGVEGHEVTLLPRHWEWLRTQRGGPSATLRRLVEEARARSADRDRQREAQDAINRFISAVAGDLEGFEEANRALYRGDAAGFARETSGWPIDVRRYLEHWTERAWP